MTAIGFVEVVVCGGLAVRAGRRKDVRYRRYIQGVWGFAAWTALCVARLILLQ
jgi:hypothetical protein